MLRIPLDGGRNVIDQLVKRGADVRALVRDPTKAKLPSGVTVVKGDLLDVDALRSAFSGVSTLFLLNAVAADEVERAAVGRVVEGIALLSARIARPPALSIH